MCGAGANDVGSGPASGATTALSPHAPRHADNIAAIEHRILTTHTRWQAISTAMMRSVAKMQRRIGRLGEPMLLPDRAEVCLMVSAAQFFLDFGVEDSPTTKC
jgi:hypothetical protein